jgi:hypothetical protein
MSQTFDTDRDGLVLEFDYFYDFGALSESEDPARIYVEYRPSSGVPFAESTDPSGCFESILGVDNVTIVPVPPALLLGGLGFGFAGGLLSRFRGNRRSVQEVIRP